MDSVCIAADCELHAVGFGKCWKHGGVSLCYLCDKYAIKGGKCKKHALKAGMFDVKMKQPLKVVK